MEDSDIVVVVAQPSVKMIPNYYVRGVWHGGSRSPTKEDLKESGE